MSNIIVLDQGSSAWHAHRQRFRNASETPAVLGLSPYQSAYQLWLLRTGRKLSVETDAMRHGKTMEPAARLAYEAQTGLVMEPQVLVSGEYSASLDGLALDGDLILEIKCPVRGRRSDLWQEARSGVVPLHYYFQLQHQLMVSGAALAHLFVFDGEQGVTVDVKPEPETWEEIRTGWDAFMVFVGQDQAPPLTETDTLFRDDGPWQDVARAFVERKRAVDAAEAELAKVREALIALQQHPREEGAGVQVTRFMRSGTIDYKKVPELAGVDLERYRGPGREEIRITLA
jgi:putative phage-type endonuclease